MAKEKDNTQQVEQQEPQVDGAEQVEQVEQVEAVAETVREAPKALTPLEQLEAKRKALRAAHEDRVCIKLPLEKKLAKSLLVSVNGIRYLIERGKPVWVPYVVAEVIEQSVKADAALQARIEQLTSNPASMVI